MFIVKKEADIPCPRAKQVDPHEMPPIRPNYLPRPYAWEVFQAEQDPNNPYNLVDRARTVRESGREPDDTPQPRPQSAPPDPTATPETAAGRPTPGLPPVSAAPPPPAPLALSVQETRDLVQIVELTQQRMPARFERAGAGAAPALVVDLAYSRAFEARLRDHFAGDGLGPVLLFTASAIGPEAFHANLTFVQGHAAFHPDRDDPRQFGLLTGALGPLAAGETLLGYVVLPADVDLATPLDVYWNDRRISVALRR
jgi:hypothetical protein